MIGAFAEEKDAPPPNQGWVIVSISSALILVACWLRSGGRLDNPDSILAVLSHSRDFAMGFFTMSLIPSSIVLSKIIGLFSSARFLTSEINKAGRVGFAVGTAILGFINFTASVVTITTVIVRGGFR